MQNFIVLRQSFKKIMTNFVTGVVFIIAQNNSFNPLSKLTEYSFWFDTINLGCSIVCLSGNKL